MRWWAIAFAIVEIVAQYGHGSFAETGTMLSLDPPDVSIRSDGRIIYRDDDGVWTAVLPRERVERLQRDLRRNRLLDETAYVPTSRPRPILIHGGMSYIVAGDVVLATSGMPTRGPWMAIVNRIREEIPLAASSWLPESLTFAAYPDQSPIQKPLEWPFASTLPLAGGSHETTDRAAIEFLMRNYFGRNGWRNTYAQNGVAYRLYLLRAPGWLDDGTVAIQVEMLRPPR